jgi:hypothetical protein
MLLFRLCILCQLCRFRSLSWTSNSHRRRSWYLTLGCCLGSFMRSRSWTFRGVLKWRILKCRTTSTCNWPWLSDLSDWLGSWLNSLLRLFRLRRLLWCSYRPCRSRSSRSSKSRWPRCNLWLELKFWQGLIAARFGCWRDHGGVFDIRLLYYSWRLVLITIACVYFLGHNHVGCASSFLFFFRFSSLFLFNSLFSFFFLFVVSVKFRGESAKEALLFRRSLL